MLEEMEKAKVEKHVREQGCEWVFNLPHISHFGGVWKRQIGTIRRIIDAMFAELENGQVTHKLPVTFMAEVSAIINVHPIAKKRLLGAYWHSVPYFMTFTSMDH